MKTKEQLAEEFRQRYVGERHLADYEGDDEFPEDFYLTGKDIKDAFLAGWDAAMASLRAAPRRQGRMHSCDIPGCDSCGNPEAEYPDPRQHWHNDEAGI